MSILPPESEPGYWQQRRIATPTNLVWASESRPFGQPCWENSTGKRESIRPPLCERDLEWADPCHAVRFEGCTCRTAGLGVERNPTASGHYTVGKGGSFLIFSWTCREHASGFDSEAASLARRSSGWNSRFCCERAFGYARFRHKV